MPYLIFALFITLNPILAKAANEASCLFIFAGKSVAPVPEPIVVNSGLEALEEGARVVTREHAFGAIHFVLETNALRLREILRTGEVNRELVVTADGAVRFTHWEQRYCNTEQILPEQGQALIQQLKRSLDQRGRSVTFAANELYKALHVYVPAITVKTQDSTLWDSALRQPVPLDELDGIVGREHRHGFGQLRFIFDARSHQVFRQSLDKAGKQVELITLSSDGTVTRQVGDNPPLVAHMDEVVIAPGILNHAYVNTALGGWKFQCALRSFREFVLAEVPDLFVEELPDRKEQNLNIETKDGIVPFSVDNGPKYYNPDLGVNQ